MPDYGSEVLDAAATAISDARRGPLSGALSWTEADYARALARAALDAAAPLLAEFVAEAERERIRQLASLVSASYFVGTDEHGPDIRQFAGLIGEGYERIQPRRAS